MKKYQTRTHKEEIIENSTGGCYRCPACGIQINPYENTHSCQPVGSTTYFQVFQGALTPLGELVKAIQDFRDKMAKDRCSGHCKVYQEEIQKLSELLKRISNG